MLAQKRTERKTKPRYDRATGAASWLVAAMEDGRLMRAKLTVCQDGRVYFGLSSPQLRPTETVNDEGQRMFVGCRPYTGRAVTVLVSDKVYQTLKGMV